MKNLNNYITEKFKVSSKNIEKKLDKLSTEDKFIIIDKLCLYFQGGGSYQGKEYETRLEIVEKYFDNDIYDYFDRLDLWDDLADFIKCDCGEIAYYIEMNREYLYEEIKDFVLK